MFAGDMDRVGTFGGSLHPARETDAASRAVMEGSALACRRPVSSSRPRLLFYICSGAIFSPLFPLYLCDSDSDSDSNSDSD